jgi:large subunit ribosomal protein L1
VGKVSFGVDKLGENADALIGAVIKAKPSAAKGKYVRAVSLSSTMGPGIKVDEAALVASEA